MVPCIMYTVYLHFVGKLLIWHFCSLNHFYTSLSILKLRVRVISCSKWTIISKLLSPFRCQNDSYDQNTTQNKYVSFQRSPCRTPQWASTLPILSQKASPLNQALVMSALYAFLPGYTPKYITNQFPVKF